MTCVYATKVWHFYVRVFLFYKKAKSRIERKRHDVFAKKLVFSGGESLSEIIRIAVGQW